MKRAPVIVGGLVLGIAMTANVTLAAERAGATPTFNTDVASILFENCVSCHRTDQIAPMVLTSYQDVRPWARAIKDKIVKREMPPWYADPRFGTFSNNKRLTQAQIDTIVAWVDGGAPEGETPLAAQLPVFEEGWIHPSGRPPDFIVAMAEPFDVPAEGEMPNFSIYQEVPPELAESGRFLEAIQMLPEVIPAMHHASFGIRPLQTGTRVGTGELWPGGPVVNGALLNVATGLSVGFAGDANTGDAKEGGSRSDAGEGMSFCCYVPGGGFQQFGLGVGKRIPTGDAYVSWNLHYTAIGRPVTDRTRVGLWFQDEIHHEIVGSDGGGTTHIIEGKQLVDDQFTPLRTNGLGNTGFPAIPVIPPFTDDWAITSIKVFPNDVTVHLMWAHMHTRGQEMTYLVTYPDGREEVLLSVPNYNFNWQQFYQLETPVKIPAGSTLKTIGSYDNSVANRWNPAPQKEVYWSEQSWDEMYLSFIDFTVDKRVLGSTEPTTDDGGE